MKKAELAIRDYLDSHGFERLEPGTKALEQMYRSISGEIDIDQFPDPQSLRHALAAENRRRDSALDPFCRYL